ncbi:sigma-70 family RNA polymerase sigma factor [Aquihabitans sp. G128]|uniref:RNA polymerase sigma factor n=1 Tax=Aquihabitans sp. G128 TaxID=2849779 RepID=UPI001C211EFF|nr:sigma-70 family RNA polymerase sigma factor [Aquihabitans sp. G128]QXC62748.1 sigma-70 family RNA polymerase sigma factor [Aquihabitans sp. G128]
MTIFDVAPGRVIATLPRPAWEGEVVGSDEGREAVERAFEQARAGSAEGWAELYVVARPQLFRFARLRLASDEQAEDAVSETIVRAMGAAERYRAGSGVLAWLVGICRNVLHEAHRSGSRLQSVDPAGFVERATAVGDAGPAEQAVSRSEAGSLREAFALLSDTEQELLSLRVVVGLDAEAVGAVLGKRPGAIRMAQSRALDRLRGHLEEGS